MQGEIGIDDPDQSHVRKMQTFRDHLRADQDVDLAGTKISQRFAISFLPCHRVRVHPPNDGLWKNLAHYRFDFLGAEARINEAVFSASRAFLWYGRGMAAEVATQPRGMPMKGQRNTAIRAIASFAATAAKQRSGKAASIQKQDGLFAPFQTAGDRVE